MACLFSLQDLWFSYDGPGHPVLEGFSLDIPAGVTTALLGPNGCGKTTLLRLILGTLNPQRGSILLDGRPQVSYSRSERSQLLGLVPQTEHIPFNFSVIEYVLMGRTPHLRPLQLPGEDDRRVAFDALQAAGIAHLAERPVNALSGGERQLVLVARALAQGPRILLLDEPTAHLDLGNRGRIVDILRNLAAGGINLLLTTHDPGLASAVADLVVLLRDGQVQDSGPTEQMLETTRLSATYGVAVRVHQVDGRRVVLLP